MRLAVLDMQALAVHHIVEPYIHPQAVAVDPSVHQLLMDSPGSLPGLFLLTASGNICSKPVMQKYLACVLLCWTCRLLQYTTL